MLDAILGVCMFFLTDSSFAKNCTFLDINQALAGNIFLVAQNRFCTKLNFLKLQVLRNGFSEICEIELDKQAQKWWFGRNKAKTVLAEMWRKQFC